MNEEILCIANKEKMAKDEWENDDSFFFRALWKNYVNSLNILSH